MEIQAYFDPCFPAKWEGMFRKRGGELGGAKVTILSGRIPCVPYSFIKIRCFCCKTHYYSVYI